MLRILSLTIIFISINLYSQNAGFVFKYLGDEYTNETYLGVSASYTFLSNAAAPYAENHAINGWTGRVDIRRTGWDKGELKYMMNYKLLGDLILILENQVNADGKKYYRSESSSITNGPLGWHSFAWGFLNSDIYSLGFGFNMNDYILGASYYKDSLRNKMVSDEPQGYYFGAGPAFCADFRISNWVMIHFQSSYSFSYWRPVSLSYATVDNSYPKPHFFHSTLEMMSPWGLFFGIDYSQIINRGNLPNKIKRTDLLLGFRFVL